MTVLALLEVAVLLMGIQVVAAGIHLRTAAPAQRRAAWWKFGAKCLLLASLILVWRGMPDVSARNVKYVYTGWDLAVMILVLIMMGISSVNSLIREVRRAFAHHTAPPH